jgi:hypothetical protein
VFKRWAKATNLSAAISAQNRDDRPRKPPPAASATELHRELEAAEEHIAELEDALATLKAERERLIDIDWDPVDKIVERLFNSPRGPLIYDTLQMMARPYSDIAIARRDAEKAAKSQPTKRHGKRKVPGEAAEVTAAPPTAPA